MRLAPWLAAPLLVASLHAQATRPDPTAPVSTEFRVFDGAQEVTATTRLRVVLTGKRDGPAIEPAGPIVPLVPAMYDVQVLRGREPGVVNIRWAERLAVMHYPDEGGRHL